MRGADLINAALPDELLDDVIRRVGAGGGAKRDLDACALVCRRWRRLERASRRSARLAASGERADEVLRLVAERFTALAEVSVDERLTAASGSGSATRSYRSGMERGPYRAGMVRLASPSLDPGAGIPACRRRRRCVRPYANCDKKCRVLCRRPILGETWRM